MQKVNQLAVWVNCYFNISSSLPQLQMFLILMSSTHVCVWHSNLGGIPAIFITQWSHLDVITRLYKCGQKMELATKTVMRYTTLVYYPNDAYRKTPCNQDNKSCVIISEFIHTLVLLYFRTKSQLQIRLLDDLTLHWFLKLCQSFL